jgi:hypothetical protein
MNPRLWHPANIFPTPRVKLLVKTKSGSEIEAIRPNYAQSFKVDPDYRQLSNQEITINEVIQWSIL